MTTQQLQCFIQVAELLNFTQAAKELYLSVPTVTHHIQMLEEELETKLFYRNSKMVKLTDEGLAFYQDAKDILDKINRSKTHLQKNKQEKKTLFCIGCTNTYEVKSLEIALELLHQDHPNVIPKIYVGDIAFLTQLFTNQHIDLILSTDQAASKINGCHFKKILLEQAYAIVANDHPLAKQNYLRFEKLASETLILLHPRFIPFQFKNTLQEKITLHGQHHEHLILENEEACITLAKSHYGIALLPGYSFNKKRKDITIIPIMNTKTIEYGFIYQDRPEYLVSFIKNFKENLESSSYLK